MPAATAEHAAWSKPSSSEWSCASKVRFFIRTFPGNQTPLRSKLNFVSTIVLRLTHICIRVAMNFSVRLFFSAGAGAGKRPLSVKRTSQFAAFAFAKRF
ncbi:MAG: hypothetical protein ACXWFY_06850 [Chthoniobacterales bacterium]